MGHDLENTVASFPTYAELTQTRAWSQATTLIRADGDTVEHAADVSTSSRYTEGPILGVGGMGKVVLA